MWREWTGNAHRAMRFLSGTSLRIIRSRTIFCRAICSATRGRALPTACKTLVIGDTHTLSPTMVNTATLNFGRTATVRTANPAIPNLCSLGTMATCPLPNYLSYDFSAPGFLGYDYENVFGVDGEPGMADSFASSGTGRGVPACSDEQRRRVSGQSRPDCYYGRQFIHRPGSGGFHHRQRGRVRTG